MRTPQRIQRAKRGKYFQSFRCNRSSPTSIASLSVASLSTNALYIKVLKVIGKFNINLKVPRWAAFLSWCQLLRPERAPPWTRLSAAQQESRAGIFLDPYFAPDQSVWISLWSKLRPDHAWVLLCVEPENVVRQRDPGQLHWQRRRGWGTYMRLLFFLKTSTNPSLHLEWSPLLIDWSWLTNQ